MKLQKIRLNDLLEEIDNYQWTKRCFGFYVKELYQNNILNEFKVDYLEFEFEENTLFLHSDTGVNFNSILVGLCCELITSIYYCYHNNRLSFKINTKHCTIDISSINDG